MQAPTRVDYVQEIRQELEPKAAVVGTLLLYLPEVADAGLVDKRAHFSRAALLSA